MIASPPRPLLLALLAAAAAGGGLSGTAGARVASRSYVVSRGDSLWRIARASRCEVERIRRANRLAGSAIRPGQRLRIPDCSTPAPASASASRIAVARLAEAAERAAARGLQSIGRPQAGRLENGVRLPPDPDAYFIRRPERAWGASNAVEQVLAAIAAARAGRPWLHPLAIGDLSARHGGRITMHSSHQSGRDADLGFYFVEPPRGYPVEFVVATEDNLDFEASWALLAALAATVGHPGGVERIFMTYSTQELFYRLALEHGIPRSTFEEWFQVPYGPGADHGFIRHEPGHDEHIHVRFRCAPGDDECR
jgi:hypothetical protein